MDCNLVLLSYMYLDVFYMGCVIAKESLLSESKWGISVFGLDIILVFGMKNHSILDAEGLYTESMER